MKPSPYPIVALFLLSILTFGCQPDRPPADNPYAEQERFINSLTHVYERQQEEPLPADTFRLLRTAVADLERADPDRHYRIMARAFIMWAVYAELQGAEPDIPAYLQKAEELLTGKTHPEDLKLLGAVFNHLGTYYSTHKEDLGMSRAYKLKELEIFRRLDQTGSLATAYINLGTDASRGGRHADALSYFDSAAVYLEQIDLDEQNFVKHCGLYFNIGHAMLNQGVDRLDEGRFERARECFATGLKNLARAESVLDGFPQIDTRMIRFYINQNQTRILTEMGETRNADQLLLYAESLPKLLEGSNERESSYLSLAYGALAVAQAVKGACDKAREAIAKGLEAQAVFRTGDYEMVYNKFNYVRFLYLKAFSLQECATRSGSSALLEEALRTYEDNLAFMESMRRDLVSEEGEERLNKTFAQYAGKASLIALSLYEETSDKSYLEKAFGFSERSKAVSLRRALTADELLVAGSGQMQALARRENGFRTRITDLDGRFYQASTVADKSRIRDSLLLVRRQYDGFINELKSSPDETRRIYYRNRYDHSVPTVEQIQAQLLDERTALIEYQFHGREAVAFVITKDLFTTIRIPVTEQLFEHLKAYSENLAYEMPMEQYIQSAPALYEVLLQKIIEQILPESVDQLIIVPAKVLAETLFENFLTGRPEEKYPAWSSLPYLFKKLAVGYVPSVAGYDLLHAISDRRADRLPMFLGLIASPNGARRQENQNHQSGCSAIPLTELGKATKKIAAAFPKGNGKVMEKTRKSDYLKEASKADILHFAVHGCLDASGSYLANYLQFLPDDQTDGRFTSGEILQFPLKARLAVLASCNTGRGDLSRSEGLKSIARSFIMAGCPAVVATLNVVKDATTAEIMEGFYDELQKGASVAEALRLAKLQYCEHAPEMYAHPKYWANIIALGDPRPIYR